MEHAAARMSLYLGRLKVLKSGLGRKAGGKYLAMGRCGLVSCWAEVEKRFGFTALEAYTDSIRAYRCVRKREREKGNARLYHMGRRSCGWLNLFSGAWAS